MSSLAYGGQEGRAWKLEWKWEELGGCFYSCSMHRSLDEPHPHWSCAPLIASHDLMTHWLCLSQCPAVIAQFLPWRIFGDKKCPHSTSPAPSSTPHTYTVLVVVATADRFSTSNNYVIIPPYAVYLSRGAAFTSAEVCMLLSTVTRP